MLKKLDFLFFKYSLINVIFIYIIDHTHIFTNFFVWPFRQNGFSVITADRIFSFTVEDPEEVGKWVDGMIFFFFLYFLLQFSKFLDFFFFLLLETVLLSL